MKPPHVKHIFDDVRRGVKYQVLAYRELSREEVVLFIKDALSRMPKSKRPKRGEVLTIHTVAD